MPRAKIRKLVPSASTGISLLALAISLGGAGYAATGGTFILGQDNSAATRTALLSNVSGAAFLIQDVNTAGGTTALRLQTAANRPPMAVTSSAKVASLNADLLDGMDATAFIQGTADGQAIAIRPNTNGLLGPATGGLLRFRYECPNSIGGNGTLRIVNTSAAVANLFVDRGGGNPDYVQLGAGGGFIDYPAAAGGESFSIQAQGTPGVQIAEVATVHRSGSNDCYAQALLILAP